MFFKACGLQIITPPRIQDTSPWACSWEVPRNDRPPQPDTHTQSCGNSPSCPLFSMVSVPTKLEVFCFMRVVCIYFFMARLFKGGRTAGCPPHVSVPVATHAQGRMGASGRLMSSSGRRPQIVPACVKACSNWGGLEVAEENKAKSKNE